MRLRGSCLCGGVTFEAEQITGPFELCHCSRCQKASGSAYAAAIAVAAESYRIVSGAELVTEFSLPLRGEPPPYRVFFCRTCGSPLPDPQPDGTSLEIPAGLVDGDIGARPDRHIYAEHRADWNDDVHQLPAFTSAEIRRFRDGNSK